MNAEQEMQAILDAWPTGEALKWHGPPEEPPRELSLTARELAGYVAQLGRIVSVMQRRMDEMERERLQRVTLSHAQALQLQRAIRARAAEVCAKYALPSPQDAAAFRGAIKKEVLARYGVKDLHDLPLAALENAREQIGKFSDIALVMARRARAQEQPGENGKE